MIWREFNHSKVLSIDFKWWAWSYILWPFWCDVTWYWFLVIGNESLYGLDGQIRHKLAFINETLTKDCKITFIGHSIGCQIIMELMKELSYESANCDKTKSVSQTTPTLTINKAYFLFPTIERMRQTPAGRVTWIQVTQ